MRSTVTPIITAIVYKTLFKILINKGPESFYNTSTAPQKILENTHKFKVIGFPSEDEVQLFADTYLDVITTKNIVAYSVIGDDVVRCLRFMNNEVKTVVTYGFSVIFDCSVANWKNASQQLKEKIIHNCKILFLLFTFIIV